jgi:hypothetical protein
VISGDNMPRTPVGVAERWIYHFNARDVESLVRLYAQGGRHTSPRIRALYPETNGDLIGRSALLQWWEASLKRTPLLHYEALKIVGDATTAFVEYVRRAANEPDTVVVQRFDVENGEIVSSRVFL